MMLFWLLLPRQHCPLKLNLLFERQTRIVKWNAQREKCTHTQVIVVIVVDHCRKMQLNRAVIGFVSIWSKDKKKATILLRVSRDHDFNWTFRWWVFFFLSVSRSFVYSFSDDKKEIILIEELILTIIIIHNKRVIKINRKYWCAHGRTHRQ